MKLNKIDTAEIDHLICNDDDIMDETFGFFKILMVSFRPF